MKPKKIFFCGLFILLYISFVFSQDKKDKVGIEIGFNLVNQYPIGNFFEYTNASLGGEFYFNCIFPKELVKSENLGFNVSYDFLKVFPKENMVEYIKQKSFSFGLFYLFNLPKKFKLRPQINFGFITHSFSDALILKKSYSDILFSFCCEVQYLWKYNINFNISPVYTLIPVKEGVINYLGLKIGAGYRF